MNQLPAHSNDNQNKNEVDISRIFNEDRFLDENRAITLKDTDDWEFLEFFFHMELRKNDDTYEPLSPHTLRAYRNDGKTLVQFLQTNQFSLRNIGDPEVKMYCDYIKEKYAIRTSIRKLDFFRRLLKFGADMKFYSVDFSGRVKNYKPKSIKGHFSSKDVQEQNQGKKIAKRRELTERDAKILIGFFEELVEDTPRNKSFFEFLKIRNSLIGWLLFGTGMRASELTGVTFGSFFEEDEILHVEVLGKGNKPREIPIFSATIKELFIKHKESVKDKYDLTERELRKIPVLFSPVGVKVAEKIKPMSYNNLYKIVKKAAHIAEKNPDVSPHWFRHTYITFLLEQNVPLAVVKDNAGHSNIATTNIYLETIENKAKRKHMSHVNFD